MKQTGIHVGELIESVFNTRNISKAEFARRIHTTRQNITTLFKRPDINVKLLFTISQVLEYDFVQHFSIKEPGPVAETEVSIQLKVKSSNVDELLKWVSHNGSIQIFQK